MKTIKIFISALEYSANIHLANLLKEIEKSEVSFSLYGIFDENLLKQAKLQAQESIKSDYDPSIFRAMGFVNILALIPRFLKIKGDLARIAAECDIALFMDSSSFNIPLIQSIRKLILKTKPPKIPHIIYYILPQVWAWKPRRAKLLSEICDELWGILPFERDFYPPNSPISYVGHPLLDVIPFSLTSRQETGKIAFMPGSRKSEIKALFPIFYKLAESLKSQNKEAILIIPKAFKNQDLARIYGDTSIFEISFDTYLALSKSEFAFVCSGTATLESTLLGIPTILAYRAKFLDFLIAKALVKLNYIGLANIFLEFYAFKSPKNNPTPENFPIHPEFLQSKVSVENLQNSYLSYNYTHFFNQKAKLLEYLKYGSAESCAKKLQNFAKNL